MRVGVVSRVADRAAELGDVGIDLEPEPIERNLTSQAVAVRVQAGAGEAEDDVSDLDLRAVDNRRLLDDADAEAGHVVITGLVEVGKNRRLAADQAAARLDAAVADSLHERRDQVRIVLRQREVVEEAERLGADAEGVVDRHRDQVDSDRVVPVHHPRDLELGADAVGRAHEHRVVVLLEVGPAEQEQAREAAEAVEDPAAILRSAHMRGHRRQRLVVKVEVEPGVAIGEFGHFCPCSLPRRRRALYGGRSTAIRRQSSEAEA